MNPLTGMDDSDLTDKILRFLEPYEFRTFVLGFDRPESYDRERHEDSYRKRKQAIGEEITRRLPGVDVDFLRPDLRVDIAMDSSLRLQVAPLFIAGRYRKLSRSIPSTRWIHHACRGLGCPSCSHTGNLCGPSVQELLSGPVLRACLGKRALFHGLGREDVDARMLGAGRPFVLEAHHPMRRTLPLDRLREEFHQLADGLAEISALRLTGPEARTEVKCTEAEKTYRAWLDIEGTMDDRTLGRIESLAGVTVDQLSPSRVQHRRGRNALRQRKVLESVWLGAVDGRNAWEVRVEAGMYVKELVSGDDGRTRPSLSEIIGRPCRCERLDVLEVHWVPPWEQVVGQESHAP